MEACLSVAGRIRFGSMGSRYSRLGFLWFRFISLSYNYFHRICLYVYFLTVWFDDDLCLYFSPIPGRLPPCNVASKRYHLYQVYSSNSVLLRLLSCLLRCIRKHCICVWAQDVRMISSWIYIVFYYSSFGSRTSKGQWF